MKPSQVAEMLPTLRAVLHQLEHGEAADAIDGTGLVITKDARADLRWCRHQLRQLLKGVPTNG